MLQAHQAPMTPFTETTSTYGFCPQCGSPGERRERRPNGNDTCKLGHVYPSRDAIMPKPERIALDEAYEKLVSAIVKAVPEKERIDRCYSTRKCACGVRIDEHLNWVPCLEDVLRAIKDRHGLHASSKVPATPLGALFGTAWSRSDSEWHLGHDLAWHRDNAPETIRFLHSLIVP